VAELREHGIDAQRVPNSGSSRGRFSSDVHAAIGGDDRRIECKCTRAGFRRAYDWLGDADLLVLRADRRPSLVVIPLALFAELTRK
jgi:hypothetical protein